MTRLALLVSSLTLAVSGLAHSQSQDLFNPSEPLTSNPPTSLAGTGLIPQGTACSGVLYDNGPLVTSTGNGPGGADLSTLQNTSLGMTTIGFGHQVVNNNTVADDFTVPAPGWNLDCVVLYAYQTGSTTTSTITGVRARVLDGPPGDPGSNVVFGDLVTNRLISTGWTGIYRVTESAPADTGRPIMASAVDLSGLSLGPGTYWIEWFAEGSLASGPWAPPITILGNTTTGNALQGLNGVYGPANDGSTATQQGFPFVLQGSAIVNLPDPVSVPATTRFGLALLALLALGLALVTLRYRH